MVIRVQLKKEDNMKKIYIIPTMDVVKVKHNTSLLQVSYTQEEAKGDAEVLSRGFSFGGDDEE